MTEIITYIQANWTVWLFGLVGAVLGYIIQKLRAQQKEYRADSKRVSCLKKASRSPVLQYYHECGRWRLNAVSQHSIYGICAEQKALQFEKRGFSLSWRIPPENKMPGIGTLEKMVVYT